MWRSRWTRSTWLFMAGRYVTFICVILEMMPTPNKNVSFLYVSDKLSLKLCNCSGEFSKFACIRPYRLILQPPLAQLYMGSSTRANLYLTSTVHISTWVSCPPSFAGVSLTSASKVFTGLRTYALAGQYAWVFCVLFGLSGLPVIINIVSLSLWARNHSSWDTDVDTLWHTHILVRIPQEPAGVWNNTPQQYLRGGFRFFQGFRTTVCSSYSIILGVWLKSFLDVCF